MKLHLPQSLRSALSADSSLNPSITCATTSIALAAGAMLLSSQAQAAGDIYTENATISYNKTFTDNEVTVRGDNVGLTIGKDNNQDAPGGTTLLDGTTTINLEQNTKLILDAADSKQYNLNISSEDTSKLFVNSDINLGTGTTISISRGNHNFMGTLRLADDATATIYSRWEKRIALKSLVGDASSNLILKSHDYGPVFNLYGDNTRSADGSSGMEGTVTLQATWNGDDGRNCLVLSHENALKSAALNLEANNGETNADYRQLQLNVENAYVRNLYGLGRLMMATETGNAGFTAGRLTVTAANGTFKGKVDEGVTLSITGMSEPGATYTLDGVTINGTLLVGADATVTMAGTSSLGTLSGSGTLKLADSSTTALAGTSSIGSLTGNGTLKLQGSAKLTINQDSSIAALEGGGTLKIAGEGNLSIGAHNITLSGNNISYDGIVIAQASIANALEGTSGTLSNARIELSKNGTNKVSYTIGSTSTALKVNNVTLDAGGDNVSGKITLDTDNTMTTLKTSVGGTDFYAGVDGTGGLSLQSDEGNFTLNKATVSNDGSVTIAGAGTVQLASSAKIANSGAINIEGNNLKLVDSSVTLQTGGAINITGGRLNAPEGKILRGDGEGGNEVNISGSGSMLFGGLMTASNQWGQFTRQQINVLGQGNSTIATFTDKKLNDGNATGWTIGEVVFSTTGLDKRDNDATHLIQNAEITISDDYAIDNITLKDSSVHVNGQLGMKGTKVENCTLNLTSALQLDNVTLTNTTLAVKSTGSVSSSAPLALSGTGHRLEVTAALAYADSADGITFMSTSQLNGLVLSDSAEMVLTLTESVTSYLASGDVILTFAGLTPAEAVTLDGSDSFLGFSLADSTYNIDVALSEMYSGNSEYVMLYINGTASPAVPEPATATLSLLALAGLAARRRRK